MRVFPPFTPVRVTWEDAQGATSDQHDSVASALRSYKPCIRKTVGLYIGIGKKDGRKAMLIASDDDRDVDNPDALGGPIWTPVGMVIRIEPMSINEYRKRRIKRKK